MKSVFAYFYRSFFDRKLYREIITASTGKIVLYFFLLVVFSSMPSFIKGIIDTRKFVNVEVSHFVEQLPDFRITDGELQVNGPVPLYITTSEGEALCMIDTSSGDIQSGPDGTYSLVILKDRLIFNKSEAEQRVYNFDQIDDLTLTRADINSWIRFYPLVYIFVWSLIFIWMCLVLLLEGAVNALAGVIISKIMNVSIVFGRLFVIAVVASTPALLLNTVLDFFKASFAGLWFLCFAVSVIYLCFAIHSVKTAGDSDSGGLLEKCM